MCVTCGIFRMLHIIDSRKTDIAVADQDPAVLKTAGRMVTERIAQFMAVQEL